MENWTPLQVAARTAQFEEVIQRQYPQNSSFFKNPREFYRGLTELWNYLDAVQGLAWEQLLPFDAVCLDVALKLDHPLGLPILVLVQILRLLSGSSFKVNWPLARFAH